MQQCDTILQSRCVHRFPIQNRFRHLLRVPYPTGICTVIANFSNHAAFRSRPGSNKNALYRNQLFKVDHFSSPGFSGFSSLEDRLNSPQCLIIRPSNFVFNPVMDFDFIESPLPSHFTTRQFFTTGKLDDLHRSPVQVAREFFYGKFFLHSSLMPLTPGGVFYVIRI